MSDRYNPFSNTAALVDLPVSRCGSTVLLFIDPLETNLAGPKDNRPPTRNAPPPPKRQPPPPPPPAKKK